MSFDGAHLLLCIFATYLVRSGVVQSLHAYGENGVGLPLLLFQLSFLGTILAVLFAGPRPEFRTLSGLNSRQGMAGYRSMGFPRPRPCGRTWNHVACDQQDVEC